jgi:uncharacterized protein YmfQ (DUF2313 family)
MADSPATEIFLEDFLPDFCGDITALFADTVNVGTAQELEIDYYTDAIILTSNIAGVNESGVINIGSMTEWNSITLERCGGIGVVLLDDIIANDNKNVGIDIYALKYSPTDDMGEILLGAIGTIEFTLMYYHTVGGFVIGETVQKVDKYGSGSEVVAIPEAGYIFKKWDDGLTTQLRRDTNITYNITVTAVFEMGQHYPRLVQLGQYDKLFPILYGLESNAHLRLKILGLQLDTVDNDAINLFNEMFPNTATITGLLASWEVLTGIVTDNTLTLAQRRDAIVAALRARGGLSVAYFKNLAYALGYNYGLGATPPRIVFEEGVLYVPFRADYSVAGDQVWTPNGDQHVHMVQIYTDEVIAQEALERTFNKLKPVGIDFHYLFLVS